MNRLEPDFEDRRDAGRQLALAVSRLGLLRPVVVALPRGGIPVAFEIAAALHAPVDVLMVRKLGAPGSPEFGLGAVVDGDAPEIVWNEDVLAAVRPHTDYLSATIRKELQEIERRRKAYIGQVGPLDVSGRTVILVDDGIATGGTVRAALKALRRAGVSEIVLAVPVAAQESLEQLRPEVEHLVCLTSPEPFLAVGASYRHFPQVTDSEVMQLLAAARRGL